MFEFRYDAAVINPSAAAARVNKFFYGKPNEKAMVAVVDSELYRNRKS